MIINTGGRTDTVQYYSEWLLNRFREGYVYVRNPLFPMNVSRYELDPTTVDCVIFCSKNYEPILDRLHEITARFHTYFYYTITAYGKDIEPHVPSIDESVDTLLKLEKSVGSQKIAWRYDPVLLTKRYTIQQHFITFEHLAARLKEHIDRCIFSFVELYKKLQYNMPDLQIMSDIDMDTLAHGLGNIAKKYNIHLQSCATKADYSHYGIFPSGCMTLDILGKANRIHFRTLKHNGMRKECQCIRSHDIGAYNSCPNGCTYCYANQSPQQATEQFLHHDPQSPILLGTVTEKDSISHAEQRSFLEHINPQIPLF